jgi:probable phosphoglycerate mutase
MREISGVEIDVTVDDDWIEAAFGVWEGLTYAELLQDHAQELDQWQGSTSYAPPGGDSLDEVAQRVRAARDRTVAAFPERTVVVVTHASPVRVVLRDALDAGKTSMWRTRVSAGGLSIVRYWADGGVEVVTANATAHLVQEPDLRS